MLAIASGLLAWLLTVALKAAISGESTVELGTEGEGKMSISDPAASPPAHIDFDAPATFRKWPSLNGQRHVDSKSPYLLLDSTLNECIREFLSKPTVTRHLYEIHTSPQAPFVGEVVSAENLSELAHLRDFLIRARMTLSPPAEEDQGSESG